MRIRGSGSGFFGFGSGGGSRSDSFKQGRKPGQKVRGKLIKWVSENMAWVEIEGHRLLAQLNTHHPVGTHITFLIKQLHPEVMLKEIFEVSSVGAGTLTLASDFESSRTLFENALRPHTQNLEKTNSAERLPAFLKLLSDDNKLFTSFIDATTCVQKINQQIDTNTIGLLKYSPWLAPTSRRCITQLSTKTSQAPNSTIIESITEFDLSKLGMVRAEFLYKPFKIGYRLKLQHTSKVEELRRYLKSRPNLGFSGQIECLGITKLPQSAHGGILAEIMFKQ